MGNVLRDQCPFFTVPQEFVKSGFLRDASPSAAKLYLTLYFLAQKHSAVRLEFSNAELQNQAGLDAKSIRTARAILSSHKLIEAVKGPLGIYTYVLLNPLTREPLPSPKERTGRRSYRSPAKEHSGQHSAESPSMNFERPPEPGRGRSRQVDLPPWQCWTCKGREFWLRDKDPLCINCHPKPKPLGDPEIRPPTAAELGF